MAGWIAWALVGGLAVLGLFSWGLLEAPLGAALILALVLVHQGRTRTAHAALIGSGLTLVLLLGPLVIEYAACAEPGPFSGPCVSQSTRPALLVGGGMLVAGGLLDLLLRYRRSEPAAADPWPQCSACCREEARASAPSPARCLE